MAFTPEELKAFQDYIWKLSWQSIEIDEAIMDFIEDHLSDEDNDYLDKWYQNYWDKRNSKFDTRKKN